jgi:hypothetical protein
MSGFINAGNFSMGNGKHEMRKARPISQASANSKKSNPEYAIRKIDGNSPCPGRGMSKRKGN